MFIGIALLRGARALFTITACTIIRLPRQSAAEHPLTHRGVDDVLHFLQSSPLRRDYPAFRQSVRNIGQLKIQRDFFDIDSACW